MNNTGAATALMLTKGVGRKALFDLMQKVSADDLVDLVEHPARLTQDGGMSESMARGVAGSLLQSERIQQELDDMGVVTLTIRDESYPDRLRHVLGRDAPPVLFAIGNLELLTQPSVGFCGARKASEKGVRVATEASALLAKEGIVLVSGYASGVDLSVHQGALQAGGATIFVLAEGISHFRIKAGVKPLLSHENHLVLSEFPPGLPWMARSAMQRNSTIIGLSDAMVVIESGLTGGTYACGRSTMEYGRPLFVADYAVPANSAEGNRYFLERGALPLRGNRQGTPNIARVLTAIRQPGETPSPRSKGRTLFPVDPP